MVKHLVELESGARTEGDKTLRASLFGIECILLSTIAALARHDSPAKEETISHLCEELSSFKETLAEAIGQESHAVKTIDGFLLMLGLYFPDTASKESGN